MNRLLAVFLGFLLLVAAGVVEAGLRRVEANVHSTMLLVQFLDGNRCSAGKVKPRNPTKGEFVIAAHCVENKPEQVLIDQTPVDVVEIVFGPGDQARVTVNKALGRYAHLGAPPTQGDEVFMFGNPGMKRDQLRRGYITGLSEEGKPLADFPIAGGDSGGPVFNERGQLVAIVSSVALGLSGDERGVAATLYLSVLEPVVP